MYGENFKTIAKIILENSFFPNNFQCFVQKRGGKKKKKNTNYDY
jgi:hypothetical protein